MSTTPNDESVYVMGNCLASISQGVKARSPCWAGQASAGALPARVSS